MKNILIFAGYVASLGLTSAYGYVPPSEFVLKKWTEKSSAVNFLKITRKISVPGKAIQFKEEIRADFKSGVVMSTVFDLTGQPLYVDERRAADHRLRYE